MSERIDALEEHGCNVDELPEWLTYVVYSTCTYNRGIGG